jgi:hypothetical protein
MHAKTSTFCGGWNTFLSNFLHKMSRKRYLLVHLVPEIMVADKENKKKIVEKNVKNLTNLKTA